MKTSTLRTLKTEGSIPLRRLLVVAATVLTPTACTSQSPSGPGAPVGALSAVATSKLLAFELVRTDPSPQEMAGNASQLASVLFGLTTPAGSVLDAISASTTSDGTVFADVVQQAGLKLTYTHANGSLLVFNERVTRDTASVTDVGASAAQTIFSSALQAAVAAGALSPIGLSGANVRTSKIVQGEGHAGQAPVERTKEYIFTIPRTVNGIEVFDAGFEASVHRTGLLARLKKYGPNVHSVANADGSESPTVKGYAFLPSLTSTDTNTRASAEYPNAQVTPLGLRYWLPEGTTDAVIEPEQMYFVVPTASVEGHTVHARGFYVAYSVSNPNSASRIWPQANPGARGDVRR